MNNEITQKVSNFCKKFPKHDATVFYQKYCSLNFETMCEDDFAHVMSKDPRLNSLLNQLSSIIDYIFRDTILPLEVEDMFLALIESGFDFKVDFSFDDIAYSLKLIKSDTTSIISDMNLMSNEVFKISEKFKDKKLILDIIRSEVETNCDGCSQSIRDDYFATSRYFYHSTNGSVFFVGKVRIELTNRRVQIPDA